MGEQRGNKSASSAKELDARIRDVNKHLEKISIWIKRDRLFVRARNFPPKPGDDEGQRYEISLGVSATVSGLKVAIAKAKEIDNALVWDKFDWKPYLKGPQKPPETVEEWVQQFDKQHWAETPRTPTKENSYHKDYRLVFNRLPQKEILTFELLKETILRPPEPGKRSRNGFAMAFRRLGLLAGLDANRLEEISKLGRGYSPKSVEPRALPTDEEILDVWEEILSNLVYGIEAMRRPASGSHR